MEDELPILWCGACSEDRDTPITSEHIIAIERDDFLSYGAGPSLSTPSTIAPMFRHVEKPTYHSQSLCRTYAYVKVADRAKDSSVPGMLLYVKTNEDIVPDADIVVGGDAFSVKTLDLSQHF